MSKLINEFYSNCNVFITGATGFVGKVLIEKLLISCENIKSINILLRPNKKHSVAERFERLIENQVFERVRQKDPQLLQKIKYFSGDLSEENLGLSTENYQYLTENIDIVFSVAASIRFNETLKEIIENNVYGTYRILELCTQIKNLKSVVHVSTAYCNTINKFVPEKVMELDLPKKWYQSKWYKDDYMKELFENELKNHPNTYTMTKKLAEQVVLGYQKTLPVCIVRPSIIISAHKEPFEGWIDDVSGETAIIIGILKGMIKSIHCYENCVDDIIPVDIVVNALIVAGYRNQQNCELYVYNCTSGSINAITYGINLQNFLKLTRSSNNFWSKSLETKFHKNKLIHKLHQSIFYVFYMIYDLLQKIRGYKPVALKNYKQFMRVLTYLEFFTCNEWNFEIKNFMQLINDSKNTDFDCDIGKIQWENQIEIFSKGIKKYILKEKID